MSLANRYRPKTFDEVVGQKFVKRVLMRALERKDIPHALLLAGPRGIGKTTLARIFAKGLNCELGPTSKPCGTCRFCREIDEGRSVDVVEIDAASNRGIENVREIQEQLRYMPVSRYKVYIIDEVHMLTTEAFNSLLKTLEEPPPHVVFVLATTDPHKIPATVLSRLQKFHLKPHSISDIVERLKYVSSQEGISITDEALRMIAERSEGSLRDALVLLEQAHIYSDGTITERDVAEMLGVVPDNLYAQLMESILAGSFKEAYEKVMEITERFSPVDFASGLVRYLERHLLSDSTLPFEERVVLLRMALDMEVHIRQSSDPYAWLTYDVARMCAFKRVVNLDEISRYLGEPPKGSRPAGVGEAQSPPPARADEDPIERLRREKPTVAGYVADATYTREGDTLHIIVSSSVIARKIEREVEAIRRAFGVREVKVQVRKSGGFGDLFGEIKRDWESLD
ncbi:MAG: DNA polymerase III subunit gamma/tau [Thermotogae bacterium]|nr:DNA polymerase III subunit gamma/tau [Thermotogota bacterium]